MCLCYLIVFGGIEFHTKKGSGVLPFIYSTLSELQLCLVATGGPLHLSLCSEQRILNPPVSQGGRGSGCLVCTLGVVRDTSVSGL